MAAIFKIFIGKRGAANYSQA